MEGWQETREAVARVARALAEDGLVERTSGNVSACVGQHVAVTPTGAVLGELEAADVAIVDRDGTLVDGPLRPTSELELHLVAVVERGAGAVVHTHAPEATALSCVLHELPVVHYEMLGLGGSVRVAPYLTFGTPELARAVAEALDGRAAALLANHGTVTTGPDVDAALATTRLLEWACGLYRRAASVGTPRALGAAEQQAFVEAVVARNYGRTQEVGE